MLAMMSFVTRQYAEFTVFNGSKCFGPFSRKHTSCHSTVCASISRQRNKLAQRNKVQKEAHQMYFYAICLTQNVEVRPKWSLFANPLTYSCIPTIQVIIHNT